MWMRMRRRPAANTTLKLMGCASLPVPGAVVKVYTSSAETTLVFSGTTDALGQVYGYIPSSGTYWIDPSGNSGGVWSRFASLAAIRRPYHRVDCDDVARFGSVGLCLHVNMLGPNRDGVAHHGQCLWRGNAHLLRR